MVPAPCCFSGLLAQNGCRRCALMVCWASTVPYLFTWNFQNRPGSQFFPCHDVDAVTPCGCLPWTVSLSLWPLALSTIPRSFWSLLSSDSHFSLLERPKFLSGSLPFLFFVGILSHFAHWRLPHFSFFPATASIVIMTFYFICQCFRLLLPFFSLPAPGAI